MTLASLHLERAPARLRHRRRRPLRVRDVGSGIVCRSVSQPDVSKRERKLRVRSAEAGREGLQQRADRRKAAVEDQADVVRRQQARRVRPVIRRLRMAHRLHWIPVLLMPHRRRPVQRTDGFGVDAAQLELQEVRKEVVVAKPRSRDVQRVHEGVGVLEFLQDALRPRAAREPVGQRAAHPVEDRRAQQQLPHLWRLALEHLLQQVPRDRALAAGELGHEPLRIREVLERDRRQPQACRPSLRPLVKQSRALMREGDVRSPKELLRLLRREAQIGVPELGQLAGEP